MDNDVKKLLGIMAVAAVIIFITKPKGLFKKEAQTVKGYLHPQRANPADNKDMENSTAAILAMRRAINDNLDKKELEELNAMIFDNYGVKVYQNPTTLKLYTSDVSGNRIAEEAPQ